MNFKEFKELVNFFNCYNNVFDCNDDVKLCGREKCKELINACRLINPYGNYGDSLTGVMNIDVIKALYFVCKSYVK